MLQKILDYLNPLNRLGTMQYSAVFPLFTTLMSVVVVEFIAHVVLKNPNAVGFLAIFLFMALIMYFAFRDGIKGGIIVTLVTVGYYLYIIASRGYTGAQLSSSMQATFLLAALYVIITTIIGGLKQKIDLLIGKEADGQRRLRAIIEQLPVGVIVSNRQGVISQVNTKAHQILGKEIPLGFVLGSKPLIAATPVTTKSEQNPIFPFFAMFKRGVPVVNKEFVIKKENGSEAHIHLSFNKIENEKNKTIAAAWIIQDITDQIELEQRKDDFINMASHELKTPLTSLKLYNNFLLRTLVTSEHEPSRKIVDRIGSQVDKLQKIVEELLDVSKVKTGKLVLNREPFNLKDMMLEVMEMYQSPTKPSRLQLLSYINPEVVADRFRIYQVVSNLISNALKYSPKDQPVLITLNQDKDRLSVSVQDFGIGIEADQYELIFGRLYQVASHKRQGIQGFGMGLYICKEIIERHQGNIWVKSEKGKGSTFTFTLPKATA